MSTPEEHIATAERNLKEAWEKDNDAYRTDAILDTIAHTLLALYKNGVL